MVQPMSCVFLSAWLFSSGNFVESGHTRKLRQQAPVEPTLERCVVCEFTPGASLGHVSILINTTILVRTLVKVRMFCTIRCSAMMSSRPTCSEYSQLANLQADRCRALSVIVMSRMMSISVLALELVQALLPSNQVRPLMAGVGGYDAPLDVTPKPTALRTGGKRRRAANALPKVFLGVASEPRRVTCAFNITQVYQLAAPARPVFIAVMGGLVRLMESFRLDKDSQTHFGCTYMFTAVVEQQVRRSVSDMGSSLNVHFIDFSSERWKAWKLETQFDDLHAREPPPAYMEISEKYVTAMGVEPIVVDSLSEIFPDLDELEGLLDQQRPTAAEEISPSAPSSEAAPAQASLPGNVIAATCARHHLHSLHKDRAGGAVEHFYQPEVVIQSLILDSKLKGNSSVPDVLAASAPLFFGTVASADLVRDLQSGELVLPSKKLLLDARTRIDYLGVAFQRLLPGDVCRWRYPGWDASPAWGFNFLMGREDIFEYPMLGDETGVEGAMQVNFNAALTSRICLLSTMGRGRATLLKKFFNVWNTFRMESKDVEDLTKRTEEVFVILTDQAVRRQSFQGN